MKKEEIFQHIQQKVQDSKAANPNDTEQTGKEVVNRTYGQVRPTAGRATKSALRGTILSGDYFGSNIFFFLELLNQCGLEVVEKKESS